MRESTAAVEMAEARLDSRRDSSLGTMTDAYCANSGSAAICASSAEAHKKSCARGAGGGGGSGAKRCEEDPSRSGASAAVHSGRASVGRTAVSRRSQPGRHGHDILYGHAVGTRWRTTTDSRSSSAGAGAGSMAAVEEAGVAGGGICSASPSCRASQSVLRPSTDTKERTHSCCSG